MSKKYRVNVDTADVESIESILSKDLSSLKKAYEILMRRVQNIELLASSPRATNEQRIKNIMGEIMFVLKEQCHLTSHKLDSKKNSCKICGELSPFKK